MVSDQVDYETAGNIAIYPNNTQRKISRMKKVMNLTYDFVFTVTSKGDKKFPIPTPLSVGNYLKHFIDLNGEVTLADIIKFEELLSQKKYARFEFYLKFFLE